MNQDMWVFVAVGERPHHDHEVRILFKDRIVAIYAGELTINDFGGADFATILRCHQDPTFGWEEMSCFW